jgi:hypothetical protein
MRGCVGPSSSLDAMEKRKVSYPSRESKSGRPTNDHSLYRLSHSSLINLTFYRNSDYIINKNYVYSFHSVGIVRWWTKAPEFFMYILLLP